MRTAASRESTARTAVRMVLSMGMILLSFLGFAACFPGVTLDSSEFPGKRKRPPGPVIPTNHGALGTFNRIIYA